MGGTQDPRDALARQGETSGHGHGLESFARLDGVRHRFVDLPRLRMHVAEAGKGEAVLLLHGFPQHWWQWRKVIPGLAEQYHVVCPDLRGAGWTDAPPTGYVRDQLVADVLALMDALQLERVHLVGHDWGAIIGFQVCLNHPNRVQAYLGLGVPHPFVRFNPRLLAIAWRLWFQPMIATPGLGTRLLSRGRQRLPRYLMRGYTSNQDTWTEEDIDVFLERLRDPARARAAGALYRSLIIPEARRIMAGAYRSTRLVTPTHLLLGADDPVMRPDLIGDCNEYADDLVVEFVDGAAHFVAEERPDLVFTRARELFARR